MIAVRVAVFVLLAFGVAAGASATILYDNTGAATGSADAVGLIGPNYNSFTTDGTGAVDTITLLLDNQGTPNPNGAVDVAIYDTGTSNTPPTIFPNNFVADLGQISDTQLTGSPSLFAFAGLGFDLDPNTRYWIGLTDTSGSGATSIMWANAVDAGGIGVAGQFMEDNVNVLLDGDGTDNTGTPNQMCVSNNGSGGGCALTRAVGGPGGPVPEPSALGILGVGFAALGLFRRRRLA